MKHHLLVFLLCVPLTAAHAQTAVARINLVVVEGEGAATGPRQRVSRHPVIRVEDDDHRPLAGAAVVFALPVSGATGEFLNGSKTLTVVTDQDGLAGAPGLKTNDVAGKLPIYVTASYRGLRARTLINQFIEAPPGTRSRPAELRSGRSAKWKWIVLGAVAAGGAAGAYFGTHSNSASSPISISAGSVTFGSPR